MKLLPNGDNTITDISLTGTLLAFFFFSWVCFRGRRFQTGQPAPLINQSSSLFALYSETF
jgi:hypothetical protein